MSTPGSLDVVYFGGVTDKAPEDEFKAFASKVGTVTDVKRFRRFAYVTYASIADAAKAVATLKDLEFAGNRIDVAPSRTPAEKPKKVETEKKDKPKKEKKPAAPAVESAEKVESKNTVVVRGLPKDLKKEDVSELFSAAGAIKNVSFRRGTFTIRFAEEDSVEKALALSNTEIKNVKITVNRANKRTKKAKTPVAEKKTEEKPKSEKKAKTAAAPAPAATASNGEYRQVKVEGLVSGSTADQLKAHFASIGRIASAKVATGSTTGTVLFAESTDAVKALSLSGSVLNGAKITVAADPKTKKAAATESGAGKKRTADEEEKKTEKKPRKERKPRAERPKPVNTVWVSPVEGKESSEAELKAFLGSYGTIESVSVKKTFAYVKYTDEAGMNAAAAGANGKTFDGKAVEVSVASGPVRRVRGEKKTETA